MKHIKKFNLNEGLSEEDAEQLYGEIENQGFGYWVIHYSDTFTKADPKLTKLCKETKEKLKELEDYIDTIYDKYGLD